MTPRSTMACLLLTTALAACGSERRSVEYFIDHPDELKVKLAECANDPGADDPECANARVADAQIVTRKLKDDADAIVEEERKRREKAQPSR